MDTIWYNIYIYTYIYIDIDIYRYIYIFFTDCIRPSFIHLNCQMSSCTAAIAQQLFYFDKQNILWQTNLPETFKFSKKFMKIAESVFSKGRSYASVSLFNGAEVLSLVTDKIKLCAGNFPENSYHDS